MVAQSMKHHLHIGHFHLGDFTTFEMILSIFLSLLIIIPVVMYVIILGIVFLNW